MIYGVDNMNNYYCKKLKKIDSNYLKSIKFFYKVDISDSKKIKEILILVKDIVINLAAQAGVRYSLITHMLIINQILMDF